MIESLLQIVLFSMSLIECALRAILLVSETGLLVTCPVQVQLSRLILVSGLLEVVLANLGHFGEFLLALLQFEEVVVGGLDSLVRVGIFALFHSDYVSQTIDLILIARPLLLQLLQFEGRGIDILSQGVALVAFALEVALKSENFSLTPVDLLSEGSDLHLHVVVGTALIIEVEAGVVALLLKSVQRDEVRVLTRFELVLLEEFFVLQVAELGLDRVELVAQG